MHVPRFVFPAVVLFCAVAGFSPAADIADRAVLEDRERARLVAHFDSVLLELENRDVSPLSADRLAARRRHIANLREYRDAGVFPHNHVTSSVTPVFVDEHGTHCAMGYLIARSGRTDIVNRIRSDRNLARIRELADDTALVAWLDENGISVDEAARIQPSYDDGGLIVIPEREPNARPEFAAGSVAYAGLATAVSFANLASPGRPSLYRSGALLSLAGAVLALSADDRDGSTRLLARVDAGVALASFLMAAHSASRDPARIDHRRASRPTTTAFTAGPLITPHSTGVMARLSF